MADNALRSVRSGKLLMAGLALVGGLLILGRLLSDMYVELLWYRSTGYTQVYVRRLMWLWGTRLAWGAVVVVALMMSLRLVSRTLSGIQIKRRFGNLEISEQLPRTYVWWGIIGVSLLLGAWFGASIPQAVAWSVMAAVQGVEWGLVDPVLGWDLSYHVFTMPLLRSGVTYLMVLVFLVFTMSTAGYAATGAVRWGRGGIIMANQPRVHMGALVSVFLALLALHFWFSRSVLLLSGSSNVQGIFGYADAEARLPALRVMTVVTLASAVAVMWGVWRNRLIPVVAGIGAVLIGSLVVLQFYPSLVQRFRVAPNELEWETPYITHNLEFTRRGFALADLQREEFSYRTTDSTDWAEVRRQFEGLPVWSGDVLKKTFSETEARFPYYQFENVEITRYPAAEGRIVPVALSVREIDPSGIGEKAWQNLHLRDLYVRGMGAVAASAARVTSEGRPPMHLSSIPPEFTGGAEAPQGLRLTRPWVYFNSRADARDQEYVIVNPDAAAVGGGEGQTAGVPGVDFPEGILLDSSLRKLTLAWRFRDPNLLFSSQVTDSSRMVFRRNVAERASQIAPFFRYLEDPYPVIVDGRIVWILEGFTATRQFPLSRPIEMSDGRRESYLRNSVKVTVDAVTGETRFYAVPEPDPVRDAYGRAFPGLLRPLEEMPEGLRAHLRYSKTLFEVQGAVLIQYHQETAPRFHGQQDVWARPEEYLQGTTPLPYLPEYALYHLPGEAAPTFNLTTAFVPAGRQNLASVLVGRLGSQGTPELVLYDVPVEDQAPGPHQVEVMIEQHPEISQQFSLWRGTGSQVRTGHLHLVPVGSQIFYMEPIFLAATDNAIPDLRRFVVSDGRRVAMEPTLDEAIASLAGERISVTRDPGAQEVFPTTPDTTGWPREALELLERAEQRLREGDYNGFGVALQELRVMLERLSRGGP